MAWSVALPVIASVAGGLISSDATSKAADQQSQATGKAVDETKREYNTSRSDLAPYRQAGTAALSRLRQLLGIDVGSPGSSLSRDDIYQSILSDYDQQHQAKYGIPLMSSPDQTGLASQLAEINAMADAQYAAQSQPSTATPNTGEGSLLSKFTANDLNADPVYNSGLKFGLDEGTKAIERRAAANGSYDSGATLKELTRFGNDYGSQKAGDAYARFKQDQNDTYGKLSGIAGMGSGATTVGVGANSATGSNLASLYSGQGNAAGAATIAGANALGTGINNAGQYALLSQLQGGGARSLRPTTDMTGASDLGATTA